MPANSESHESELLSLLEATLESTADGILVADGHGRMVRFNRKFTEMWRLPAEIVNSGSDDDALAFVLNQLVSPEDFLRKVKELYSKPDVSSFDELVFKDGRVVERYSQPQWIGGAIAGRVWSFRDVTARKRVEQALRDSEARYRQIFDISPDALFLVGQDGRFLDANRIAVERYGYSVDELKKMTPTDLAAEDLRPHVAAKIEASRQMPRRFEWRHRTKDGCEFWVEIQTQFAVINGLKCVVVDARDIDERKTMEDRLRQAEKLTAIGQLAGGVAHDFNNMLQAIQGYAEMLLLETMPSDVRHGDVVSILNASHRATNLTRQLLTFARKQAVMPQVLNMNEAVDRVLKMLRRLIGENIELHWVPGTDLWPVRIDPMQVDQVLANLCVNSRDAIGGHGKISITARNVTIEEGFCEKCAGSCPGDYVELGVSDNGCGMTPDVLKHVFEPFFTTKGINQGTGLGLATVYGIVRQNNGFIHVESEPGKGSAFRAYLPRTEGVPTPVEVHEPARKPVARGSGETILLVDDEALVLLLGRRILERLGYVVLTANKPADALRVAREHKGELHLLISDLVMPEMSGHDLSAQVKTIHPGIKRLFISGYSADTIFRHGVADDETGPHLQKPFSIEALASTVHKVLTETV